MMVDPERIIYRLVIGSVITTVTWTLAIGDFDTVVRVLAWFTITLLVQEDVYDFVRSKRRKGTKRKLKTDDTAKKVQERMGA